jgi:SAM-dependent methyltransferase
MNEEDIVNAALYGDRIAGIYDDLYREVDEEAVERLAEFAGEGRALELGIGTGRIALPLHRRGVDVAGLDASPAMLDKLRAKPQGTQIELIPGDFSDFKLEDRFSLIYVVFNTFYGLLTQQAQVECLRCVADHLTEDGVFVFEGFVPDLCRYRDQQEVRGFTAGSSAVKLDISEIDPVDQLISSHHVLLAEDGVEIYPVELRYVWPSELDLMAQIAGLVLDHRWGAWDRSPFTARSWRHIAVYGHPDPPLDVTPLVEEAT